MLYSLLVVFVFFRVFFAFCASPRLVVLKRPILTEVSLDYRKTDHCDRVRLFSKKEKFGLKVQPDINLESGILEDSSLSTVGGKLFSLLLTSLVAYL